MGVFQPTMSHSKWAFGDLGSPAWVTWVILRLRPVSVKSVMKETILTVGTVPMYYRTDSRVAFLTIAIVHFRTFLTSGLIYLGPQLGLSIWKHDCPIHSCTNCQNSEIF